MVEQIRNHFIACYTLFEELGAVERYRAIRRGLSRVIYRHIFFDIITDELNMLQNIII